MTPNDLSHEPWHGKKVNSLWFHITREQVHTGVIAQVGTVPWSVYCAIKSHAGLETGDSWPSNARLAALVGVSIDTVQRSLKKLAVVGLIKAQKVRGKSTHYSLTERLEITEPDGRPYAVGERKYVPKEFQEFVGQLKRLADTGNMPTDKAISITFNLVIGDGNTVSLTTGPVS